MRLIPICFIFALALTVNAEELPDWSGVWVRVEGNGGMFDLATTKPKDGLAGDEGVRQYPPLTDLWEKKYLASLELAAKGRLPDPISRCGTPAGFPRLLALPDVFEFIVRPEQTWVITENGPNILRIYTDGRPHPAPQDRWLTYTGDSVGDWNGEVLEFSTVNMIGKDKTILDRSGLSLSSEAKVKTRMYLIADGLLKAELEINDPIALTAPWHVVRHFTRLPHSAKAYDYACAENNRNPVTGAGQTLTLDTAGQVIDKVVDQ